MPSTIMYYTLCSNRLLDIGSVLISVPNKKSIFCWVCRGDLAVMVHVLTLNISRLSQSQVTLCWVPLTSQVSLPTMLCPLNSVHVHVYCISVYICVWCFFVYT